MIAGTYINLITNNTLGRTRIQLNDQTHRAAFYRTAENVPKGLLKCRLHRSELTARIYRTSEHQMHVKLLREVTKP